MQPFGRLFLTALAFVAVASAQQDPPGRVGRLNLVTGTVSFQPGGVDDWVNADVNRPLTTGDHLWVDQNGRAELHIGSAAVRLSSQTFFEFLNLDDQNVQVRLGEGSIEIRLRSLDENQNFEVDTPNLAFSLTRPGIYRIDANPDNQTTTVTVRGGAGEVNGGGQAFQVNAREQARVTGDQTIRYDLAAAPPPDWFDTFCDSRDRREEQSQSAQYVSRDMIGYEDLDSAGDWRPVADYGTVWYPRGMPAGWAPYRYGHWAWIEPWGWTWVDDAPWGFAPFHYGRWAIIGGGWGWVPGPRVVRPVYAPALVAFVGGPRFNLSLSIGGGGGVAWFPLGPRERYVPAYRTSPTYVTRVNNTTVINNTTIINNVNNTTNVRYVNQNAPGVTAVSRETFVGARSVGHSTVQVNAQELASAQVTHSAAYAPSQASVLGRNAGQPARARPPDAVTNRAVVGRATPPPAPVPFQQRQRLLQQNPGQPLEAAQVQQIRSQQPAQPNRIVRQANAAPTQGQPTPAVRQNGPGNLPAGNGNAQGSPAPQQGSRRGFADPAGAPAQRQQQIQTAPPAVATPTQQPQYQDRRVPAERGQQQIQTAPPQVAPVPQQQHQPQQDRRSPEDRSQPRVEPSHPQVAQPPPPPPVERRPPPVERSQPRVEPAPAPERHVEPAARPAPAVQNEGRRERPAAREDRPAPKEKKDEKKEKP